jgi:hypothetical protein
MTTFTQHLTTPIIFGASKHLIWAQKALDEGVISERDLNFLSGEYQHCIFSGRNMSENAKTRGYNLNQKIYTEVYLKDKVNFVNALEGVVARHFNVKTYEVSIFMNESGSFKFELEDGKGKVDATYLINQDNISITIQ